MPGAVETDDLPMAALVDRIVHLRTRQDVMQLFIRGSGWPGKVALFKHLLLVGAGKEIILKGTKVLCKVIARGQHGVTSNLLMSFYHKTEENAITKQSVRRMYMKLVVITGSPHRQGTSARLAEEFIKGAKEAGHTVYRFDAAQECVHPCIGCDVCGCRAKS